jgi:hypothetical protein
MEMLDIDIRTAPIKALEKYKRNVTHKYVAYAQQRERDQEAYCEAKWADYYRDLKVKRQARHELELMELRNQEGVYSYEPKTRYFINDLFAGI